MLIRLGHLILFKYKSLGNHKKPRPPIENLSKTNVGRLLFKALRRIGSRRGIGARISSTSARFREFTHRRNFFHPKNELVF